MRLVYQICKKCQTFLGCELGVRPHTLAIRFVRKGKAKAGKWLRQVAAREPCARGLPDSCRKVSTRAFLLFLEQKNGISSSVEIDRPCRVQPVRSQPAVSFRNPVSTAIGQDARMTRSPADFRPGQRHRDGSQSAQTPAQRPRRAHPLLTGVSLSTTSRRNASKR